MDEANRKRGWTSGSTTVVQQTAATPVYLATPASNPSYPQQPVPQQAYPQQTYPQQPAYEPEAPPYQPS